MAENHPRGRQATLPWSIPAKGWWDILKRTKEEMGNDHITLIAAGGAFYALLSVFPGIAAAVAIWGLVADPSGVVEQIDGFTAALPEDAAAIIHEQAVSAAEGGGGAVLTAIVAILLGLWSASKGMKAMIEGLNVAYDEREERSFVKQVILRLTLTVTMILSVLLAAGLVVVLPGVLKAVGLPSGIELLIGFAKWALLIVGALVGFALLYRFGPDRDDARWQWLTPGAFLGVVLWIAGSAAFSIYVSNFASYNETYGSLGGAIILLMWLFLTSFSVLIGAEFNAEAERQTRRDTTVGGNEPLGERDAHAADTVGEPA